MVPLHALQEFESWHEDIGGDVMIMMMTVRTMIMIMDGLPSTSFVMTQFIGRVEGMCAFYRSFNYSPIRLIFYKRMRHY